MKHTIFSAALLFCLHVNSQTARLLYPVGQTNAGFYTTQYFSKDNKNFLTSDPENFYIWDISSGALLYRFSKNDRTSVHLSPDGSAVVSVNKMDVWLTDIRTGQQTRIISLNNNYPSAMFSNDGKFIITSTSRDSLDLWSYPGGKFEQRVPGNLTKFMFTPDGKYFISMDSRHFFKWDLALKRMAATIDISAYYIVNQTPYGNYIINSPGDFVAARKLDTLFIWKFGNEKTFKTITGNWTGFGTFGFTEDGKTLMNFTEDGYLYKWDAASGQVSRDFLNKPLSTYAGHAQFSPDGQVAALIVKKNVLLYDPRNGSLLDSFSLNLPAKMDPLKAAIQILTFSPDSRHLAVSVNDEIILYSITNKQSTTLKTWYDKTTGAMISPGNQYLLTITEDTATLWETNSWQPLVKMEMGRSNFECVFNDNATRLMMWDGRDIILWSIPDGKKISEIRNPFRGRISKPYLSGDGTKIGLVSRNGIYIWDVITKKNISKVTTGYYYQYDALALSYDGSYFMTAKKDSILLMYANGAPAGKIIRPATDSSYHYVFISPGDKYLMTHNEHHNGATVWNIGLVKKLYNLDVPDPQFSKDGKYVVSGNSVYDIATGKLIKTATDTEKKYALARGSANRFVLNINDTAANHKPGIIIMEKNAARPIVLLPLSGLNYLLYDQAGHYDLSPGMRSFVYLACGNKVITDSKEIEKLYVPGLAEKIMKNQAVKAMKITELNICK